VVLIQRLCHGCAMNKISDSLLDEFIILYEQHFKIKLSRDMAAQLGGNIMNLLSVANDINNVYSEPDDDI
jgi:hypothetical protein